MAVLKPELNGSPNGCTNGSTAKLSSVPKSTDFETVVEVETPTSYFTEL